MPMKDMDCALLIQYLQIIQLVYYELIFFETHIKKKQPGSIRFKRANETNLFSLGVFSVGVKI